jgi:hypothetical protein
MGPRQDEGSYWGYEEQGNGRLQSVEFLAYHKQHFIVMLKTGRKAQMKQ